jgi:hypothetical protein
LITSKSKFLKKYNKIIIIKDIIIIILKNKKLYSIKKIEAKALKIKIIKASPNLSKNNIDNAL